MTALSVVVPVFNEERTLPEFRRRLIAAIEPLGGDWEVVFVDDGSTDASAEVLARLHTEDPRLKALHLSRNFGHQAAISAGLDHASGDAVVTIDADLQDPPEVIPRLVEAWRAGHEVVHARRARREETYGKGKALLAAAFYRLLARLSEVPIPVDVGDFRLLDRRVVEVLRAAPERHRYVRGLSAWAGFRQAYVLYDRAPRAAGESKYGWGRLLDLAVNGLVSFSTAPLRLATVLGLVASALSFLLILVTIARRVLFEYPLEAIGWASTMIVILFLGGLQLIMLGIFGEYLGRVYGEVKHRPLYLVARTRGIEADPPPVGR